MLKIHVRFPGRGTGAAMNNRLDRIEDKVAAGIRLDFRDGVVLFQSRDLVRIGKMADTVRRGLHGKRAFYIVNRHINFTNVCIARCRFCAFSKNSGDPGAYTRSPRDIAAEISSTSGNRIRELHVVGGLNPELKLSYYEELVGTLQSVCPHATIKAFTAVELDFMSRNTGLSLDRLIHHLQHAGLGMLPGGGAEIMSRRIHRRLFPGKIGKDGWLAVMETAHRAGLTANATMLYGHIETIGERVAHLLALRDLQDRTSGFSAFIPLAFHSSNTGLPEIPPTTAWDDLKTIAVSRLLLDNFPHIKAYWVMLGEKTAQLALSFGADDLDGTVVEERISHVAGATSPKGLTPGDMRHLIESAGFCPVERDSFYHVI